MAQHHRDDSRDRHSRENAWSERDRRKRDQSQLWDMHHEKWNQQSSAATRVSSRDRPTRPQGYNDRWTDQQAMAPKRQNSIDKERAPRAAEPKRQRGPEQKSERSKSAISDTNRRSMWSIHFQQRASDQENLKSMLHQMIEEFGPATILLLIAFIFEGENGHFLTQVRMKVWEKNAPPSVEEILKKRIYGGAGKLDPRRMAQQRR